MQVIRNIKNIRQCSSLFIDSGYSIGLVPTMGALHDGHLSLINIMKKHVDKVIVSIFVNPKQFTNNVDYDLYPRNEEEDLLKCKKQGVDVVYVPTNEIMYPDGFSTSISLGEITQDLCGITRQNYFDGIMIVVLKLIIQISPNSIIFGERDYQMLFLLRKMLSDLDFKINVLQGPTIRESDGLALSSRNIYLTPEERVKANYLYNSLIEISRLLKENTEKFKNVLTNQKKFLEKNGFVIDYLEIRDNITLKKIMSINGHQQLRIFVAAYLGKCRLIDNLLVCL